MHIWDTQNAKAQLSLLLRASEKEPQEIRRHGKPVAIVLSIEDYNELMPKNKKIKKQQNLVEFLRASPLMGTDLSIKRSKKGYRDIKL